MNRFQPLGVSSKFPLRTLSFKTFQRYSLSHLHLFFIFFMYLFTRERTSMLDFRILALQGYTISLSRRLKFRDAG